MAKSIEPQIADLVNGWLKSYELDYKLQQDSLNDEIDNALKNYVSKNGGSGGNYPDVKLLLQDSLFNYYPVLIEYKGLKNKLIKLDENGQVANKKANNEPNFTNINSYALNGALHYATALLHYTNYTNIIAIGISGYKDHKDEIKLDIAVYYVSPNNFGMGQSVGEFTDLFFLKKENFDGLIAKIKNLSLSKNELENARIKKRKRDR